MNIANSEEFLGFRKIRLNMIEEGILKNESIRLNTSNFMVKIGRYKVGTDPHGWDFTLLTVIYPDGFELKMPRNYSTLSFIYANQNGKEYLITSEDYQGFTIINIDDKTINSYLTEESRRGWGWCPVEFTHWNEKENMLVVEGCYWGAPFERREYIIPNLDNIEDFTFESFDLEEEEDEEEED